MNGKPNGSPRQVVLVEPRHFEFRDYTPPRPGPGEILLQVKCALSCGTDLKFFRRGHPLFHFPSPFGHEFSGVAVAVGSEVRGFRVGDALMAAPTAPCGTCFFCLRGQENLCPQCMENMVWGAYADYLLLPAPVVARNCFKKPEHLCFEEAALLEPLACVIHAAEIAHPQSFESCAVIGAGAFGLMHVMWLRRLGMREVVIAGRGAARLKWASEVGADRVIDVQHQDAVRELSRLNGGYGPDLVIEATGHPAGWEDALRYARRGGRIVFFGGCPSGTTVPLDTQRMHYDNLNLLAPFHFRPADVRRAAQALTEGECQVDKLINARRGLSELGEVFGLLERGEVLKCAVIP